MKRLRVLGGPKHGEVMTHENRYVDIPIRGEAKWSYSYMPSEYEPAYRVFRYESRPIQLGTHCRVDVLVPPDMTEAEMYRRLADVIEEVGRGSR